MKASTAERRWMRNPVVEPSIVKKTKTRTMVHDEGGGISHEEAEGQKTRNKDERIRGTMDAGENGR